MDLEIVPGEDHFTGSVEISLAVAETARVVWLHGKSLIVGSAAIDAGATWLDAKADAAGGDFIAITPQRDLPPGSYILRITYTGEISRNLTDGVFQQQQGGDWYVFTSSSR